MFEIDSLLIRTDVTCVKIINNRVLAGIGGHLHIFNKTSTNPENIIKVFEGQKIYGFVPNSTSTQCLVYGGNKIKIFTCNLRTDTNFKEILYFACDDWILEAKWINSDNIATVFMHNIIILWSKDMKLIKKVICEEKCLLYSAYLVNDTWDNLIVLSGTVFGQVLIWWPKQTTIEDLCTVLCRLDGHKGVIFSVHYNSASGLICSTSDDRSARLWSVAHKNLLSELVQPTIQISLKCIMYGHSARVFRCQVLDDCVLTSGEDSLVNVWTLEGQLSRKIETHQGACIWGLDSNQKNNIIATGGGDCGVTLFPLNQSVLKKTLYIKNNEVPKKVVILKNNDVIIISEKGALQYYCSIEDTWIEIAQHNDLISYALLEVSLCRSFIALAGYRGTVHIYKQFSNSVQHLCTHEIEDKSRIFAFHWLSSENYLTCGPKGVITLWILKRNSANCMKILQLPPSKERWSTAACMWDNKYIAVGDRKGNIYLYSLDFTEPIQIIRKAHNYLGVTNLYFRKNELISLGRNSVVKKYHFDGSLKQVSMLSSDKLPLTWLAALCETNISLLLAFFGDEFVLWDYKKRRTLLQFNCAGGHRSWDFYKNNNDVNFVYIKDRNIHLTQFAWNSLYPNDIVNGYHISEINSARCFSFLECFNKCLFISGGEDTTLRISKVEFESDLVNFVNFNVLKSHLSSIRVVTSCKISETKQDGKFLEKHLVFSAGGRAQIVLWELQVNFEGDSDLSVICCEKCSYYEQRKTEDSETRIMDLCTILINDCIVLLSACSDGTLIVFLVVTQEGSKYEMFLIGNVKYKLKCILKVSYLEVCGRHIILSMATDGKIAFWDFTKLLARISTCHKIQDENMFNNLLDLKIFHYVQVHQSGINSFTYRVINNNQCVFLSGGDDNAVVVNLFEFTIQDQLVNVKTLSTFRDLFSHCAQITGVFISKNYFLTTSVDQKLNIFSWSIQNEELQCCFIQKYNSAIADIQGMQCFERNEVIYAILYGKGVEICKVQAGPKYITAS